MDSFNTKKKLTFQVFKNILQYEVTYLKVPTWSSSEFYDVRTKCE